VGGRWPRAAAAAEEPGRRHLALTLGQGTSRPWLVIIPSSWRPDRRRGWSLAPLVGRSTTRTSQLIYPPLTTNCCSGAALGGHQPCWPSKAAIVAADRWVCALLARHFGHAPEPGSTLEPPDLICLAGAGISTAGSLLRGGGLFLIDPARGSAFGWAAPAAGRSTRSSGSPCPVLGSCLCGRCGRGAPRAGPVGGAAGLMPMVASALVVAATNQLPAWFPPDRPPCALRPQRRAVAPSGGRRLDARGAERPVSAATAGCWRC